MMGITGRLTYDLTYSLRNIKWNYPKQKQNNNEG